MYMFMHLNSGMIEYLKFINGKDMYMLLMHTMHGAYGSAEFPVAQRILRKRWKSTRQNPKCCADTSQGRPQRQRMGPHLHTSGR